MLLVGRSDAGHGLHRCGESIDQQDAQGRAGHATCSTAPHWHGGFESSHRSHSKISHLSQRNFSRFPKAEQESRSWKNVFKTYDGNANGCHHESMWLHVSSSNWDGFARPESIVLGTRLCGCADACRKKCLLEIDETRACRIRQRTHKVLTCEAAYKNCKWPQLCSILMPVASCKHCSVMIMRMHTCTTREIGMTHDESCAH